MPLNLINKSHLALVLLLAAAMPVVFADIAPDQLQKLPPPQPGDSIETLHAKAARAEALQDHERVVDCWTMVTKRTPGDESAWLSLANAFEHLEGGNRNENEDKAFAAYAEAIRLKPEDAGAWNLRGEAYYRTGKEDKASADFSEAIRLDPALAVGYRNRAYIELENAGSDKAIADLTMAIRFTKQESDLAGLYQRRGQAFADNGDNGKAVADFSQVIRIFADSDDEGESFDAYLSRANALREEGENDKAIADYSRAIRIGGGQDTYTAYNGCGEAYAATDRRDKAIADFKAALRSSANADSSMDLAFAYYSGGEYDKAIAVCNDAIKNYDDLFAAFHDLKGAAHAAKGEAKLAALDYQQAVDAAAKACGETQWADARYIETLAAAESRVGKFDVAAKHQQMLIGLCREKSRQESGASLVGSSRALPAAQILAGGQTAVNFDPGCRRAIGGGFLKRNGVIHEQLIMN